MTHCKEGGRSALLVSDSSSVAASLAKWVRSIIKEKLHPEAFRFRGATLISPCRAFFVVFGPLL